jgi:glycosidase/uridine kinase
MRAIPLARSARRRLKLDPPVLDGSGTLDARDTAAARRVAARLNQSRTNAPAGEATPTAAPGRAPRQPEPKPADDRPEPDGPDGADATRQPLVGAGDLVALAALDAVLHRLVEDEQARGDLDLTGAAARARSALGSTADRDVERGWVREFGPTKPGDLASELLVLAALNENPAVVPLRELIDDRPLRTSTDYAPFVQSLERELGALTPPPQGAPPTGRRRGPGGSADLPLPQRLREPFRRAPGSLQAQLRWVREHWPELLASDPGLAERVALALDVLAEEARALELAAAAGAPAFGGPIPAESPDYRGLDAEPEAFSADTDWMPSVVLLAKSTYVWLEQLSQRHGRWIRTLADVPDEDLDRLAEQGVTGLWLIGLWQRSRASADIKRRRGDRDAVASAYSVDDYRIADDLGGEAAFENLRNRAMARGIRMAADMVPNHMGIDSSWVVEHPERFISLPEPPFPGYTFGGPNLSSDSGVEITLEDHYWDNSDAAVVFRRRDADPARTGDVRFIYHGNDGTSFPWNDTAQLDYLQADVREAVIQTILDVARRSPIIRFDAAMVLARRHIRRLWYPRPGEGGAIPSRAEHAMSDAEFDRRMPNEFWRDVVDRVAVEAPGTLLLAEAFWLMEGYFVRTLGMHRVYNSAFMHMLRDEDNAGYRRVMKETLEFDPRVLQRFVNFMTNPDERPAAEQYGTGDKAFAAATLLATLPGLPMLGHGQVDGLRERYGMEFKTARTAEPVDEAHLEHWDRTIVPLIRRRAAFSGTDRFHLYDATNDDGSVVEDVYAFSNGEATAVGERHSLVLVHNRHADVEVTIDHSAAARAVGGGGGLSRTRLADDLGLGGGDRARAIRFRDARTGWEQQRTAGDLADRGLRVHLGPYEARVLEVEPVAEEAVPAPTVPTDDRVPDVVTFAALAAEILARPPRLGRIRLVAVDGPGGAGKSVFARRLAVALGYAPVLETDDFASWDNPRNWWPRLEAEALETLAAGRTARFERSRWAPDQEEAWREVRPAPVIVLEGVTSGRAAVRGRLSYLVWVDAPPDVRLARGIERDGEAMRAQWQRWSADEDDFYADDPIRANADLIVDGHPTVAHDPETELISLMTPDPASRRPSV